MIFSLTTFTPFSIKMSIRKTPLFCRCLNLIFQFKLKEKHKGFNAPYVSLSFFAVSVQIFYSSLQFFLLDL